MRGDFDIAFRFPESLHEDWREAARYAGARWEQIIVADYPDTTIDHFCGNPIEETEVDYVLIEIVFDDGLNRPFIASAQTCSRVTEAGFKNGRPVTGEIRFNPGAWKRDVRYDEQLEVDRGLIHEIGHILGFGAPSWQDTDLLHEAGRVSSFVGPNARRTVRPDPTCGSRVCKGKWVSGGSTR